MDDEQDELDDEELPVTPAERLLYVLGQLYLLWHRGELKLAPADLDIAKVARLIGVSREIELDLDSCAGRAYLFSGGDVLLASTDGGFPWELIDLDAWALLSEAADIFG